MDRIMSILFCVFLPIAILLISINIMVFNEKFYETKYIEYNISSSTGLGKVELMKLTDEMFKYLKGTKDNSYLKKYFNKRELSHMEDVKEIFDKGFFLRNVSIVIFLVSFVYLSSKKSKNLIKPIRYSAFISFLLIFIIFLLYLIDFNKYFTYFHLIFFDNDLWLLDQNTDILINILPEEFFISISERIMSLFILFMSIILIVSNLFKERISGKIG